MWPSARDEEARADRGLAGLALQHGADLHQLRARLLVDLARRQRDRCRRGGRGAAPTAAPKRRAAGAAAERRRAREPSPRPAAAAGADGRHRGQRQRSTGQRPSASTRTLIGHRILRSAGARATGLPGRRRRACRAAKVGRRLAAHAPIAARTRRRLRMQRRHLIQALALAGAAGLGVLPAARARAGAREAQADDRRRRQEPALLPAAHHRRAAGLLQGRRPRRRRSPTSPAARARCRRWSAAAPTSSRAPSSTPSTCRSRASACAPSCCRAARRRSCSACQPRRCRTTRRWPTCKGKKIGVSAPGSSTNMLANFVLAQGRPQAERRHRSSASAPAAARVAAMRSGQIDAISNLDPVITHAASRTGDLKIISDTRTLRGHAGGVRRADAGGLPLRASRPSSQKNPNTVPGAGQRHRARPTSGCRRAGAGDIIKTVPENYLLGDRARVRRRLPGRQGRAVARRHVPRGRRARRRAGRWPASTRRSPPPRSTWRAIYTNDFVKRANAKYPKG